MRGRLPHATWVALLVVPLFACGQAGRITFHIDPATNPLLNPITDKVTTYTVSQSDGTLVGVAQVGSATGDLPLGTLSQILTPTDLTVTVQSGSALLGVGRVRDVQIENAQQFDVTVEVRKPLVTVGASAPVEDTGATVGAGRILDGTSLVDISSQPATGGFMAPTLPKPTTAAAGTWDGRFMVLGGTNSLSILDTGTGAKIGPATLAYTPGRIAVANRDQAVAVLDAGGAINLYTDVPTLTSAPTMVTPIHITVAGPRRLAFSTDGQTLFVLNGSAVEDPCSAATPPAANKLLAFGLDGSAKGSWTLPGFAADLAVDPATGKVLLSNTTQSQIIAIDPTTQAAATKVATVTCPSALAISGGDLFVVTAERDMSFPSAFKLRRVDLGNDTTMDITFTGPTYSISTETTPPVDPNISASFTVKPTSLVAYEMALTPDGTRAVLATRIQYAANMEMVTLLDTPCTADFEVIEYGVVTLDTQAGSSSYTSRSQILTRVAGGDVCIDCPVGFPPDVTFPCVGSPGDRISGVSALFGGL